MSSLVAGFVVRIHKRAVSAQRDTTPGSIVPDSKLVKQSGSNEEVQKSPTVVTLDSPKQASISLLA